VIKAIANHVWNRAEPRSHRGPGGSAYALASPFLRCEATSVAAENV